jgi:DNA polymerase-4
MDAFFASVEQLDHPEWRGRPVIVGGSPQGRGVVSTASYEARIFGVRSAMPSALAARACPDAIWAPARFDRYRQLSATVHEIFLSVTPLVQQVSIDEAYLDVTPAPHDPCDPVAIARDIQSRVDGIGLSCSVGVATSKTVAKIASDRDKPHGITVVHPGEERSFLAEMPIQALPGIGGATATRLHGAGVRLLGDLAGLDDTTASALMGSSGPVLVRRAAGIDDRPVREETDVKSISHEHTFPTDVRDRAVVEGELRALVARVAQRLRRADIKGRTLTVKVRYGDFTTRTASTTLPCATDLETDLSAPALDALLRVWSPGVGLRLLGFGVSGLGGTADQLELGAAADTAARSRTDALTRSLDAVRERFGPEAISFGMERIDDEDEA